ncbi:MAG: NAD(P)/FAD-dependent oxidoreductase [Deltaproteobacteria bacterium]|nr:NAD(P)/FAD-dependent oxidoreductase [Deltaproteobacteria bacterium]
MKKQKISRRKFLAISAISAATVALDWKKVAAFSARMGPAKKYPTIIIGAGLGGLCCGAYLARQGVPVTVLEQHDIPGGYATSFDRGDFEFEVSLHGTCINSNANQRILTELDIAKKIKTVLLPEFYRIKTPDTDIRIPQQDPEAYIRMLCERFPDEAAGISEFIREMVGLSDETDRFIAKKGKFFKLFFPLQFPKMWHIRGKTLAEFMDGYVSDPKAKAVLGSLWSYYGLPPERLSAFYYANATGEYLKKGSYYIRRRSQDISDALAGAIEAAGGNVRYNTEVEKIILKNETVAGVKTTDGEIFPARAVVSNAGAPTTFSKMLPPNILPAAYKKKLAEYRPSLSTFIVWLGLNREIADRIPAYSTHVGTGSGPSADYALCKKGDIANGPFSVTVYDKAYDGYSKKGTTSVMLLFLTGYEPWRKFEKVYQRGDKKVYHAQKEAWTRILIHRSEKAVIPGLSDMIEVKEAATPLTNQYFTKNPEGAIYGYETSVENAFMNRIKNKTPVPGLFLAGAWGDPGGGYEGALISGRKTFYEMMKEWGA